MGEDTGKSPRVMLRHVQFQKRSHGWWGAILESLAQGKAPFSLKSLKADSMPLKDSQDTIWRGKLSSEGIRAPGFGRPRQVSIKPTAGVSENPLWDQDYRQIWSCLANIVVLKDPWERSEPGVDCPKWTLPFFQPPTVPPGLANATPPTGLEWGPARLWGIGQGSTYSLLGVSWSWKSFSPKGMHVSLKVKLRVNKGHLGSRNPQLEKTAR